MTAPSHKPPLGYRAHRALLLVMVIACAALVLYEVVLGAQPLATIVREMIEGVHDEWRSWNWSLL